MTGRELALILGVLILDQASKWAASTWLVYGVPWTLAPVFSLTLLHNEGAAFSVLAEAGGWQRILFIVLAVGVVVYALRALRTTPSGWTRWGLVCIVPGAIGNAIDRAVFGYVVDFVHLHWQSWSFPAFNVADVAITIAAGTLVLGMWYDARHRTEVQS
ncbi:MAG: signal peptidase II [Gammaproteobacteria bacterium]|nr:signal peptidase II [Gammaproteobacteria bacterium]